MRCATPRHASHSAALRREPAAHTATPLCAPGRDGATQAAVSVLGPASNFARAAKYHQPRHPQASSTHAPHPL
ncbi:hypothetical protein TrVFT333_006632 [Trichoderma virens FT-333]|nr:hypothetical protein TrVFT333_006632 [Trichoderma virens FT-333]